MSPEQARRKKIPIDHRTDIYSLGATLYEVLDPASRRSGGRTTRTRSARSSSATRRPPRQSNPRVPRDLETIVLKCLRKEPADRYGTAEALAQDLRRFVRGDPIEARPQGAMGMIGRKAWRNRWRVFAACLVLALLAVGGHLWAERLEEAHKARVSGSAAVGSGGDHRIELGRTLRRPVYRQGAAIRTESSPKNPDAAPARGEMGITNAPTLNPDLLFARLE